ncbi:ABC transporter substrate-binding protein [Negativibacillus massiliensis]|mgnify:FL=1|uniref:ABC transporter substrate-binding protein n=1 Tax=Negativibacillus massiliensis TaxID=1871035 RepID=UPI00033D74A0|nr:ABC transporter substrate-binding protein [Negativibacillus massiliensis]CDA78754.1 uncharacterized protein BN558_02166 [Clostridium sp. CAG:242]
MIQWKQSIAILLAGCLSLSLVACSGNDNQALPEGGDDTSTVGRYIETPIEADWGSDDRILGMQTNESGTVSFYTVSKSGDPVEVTRHEIGANDVVTSQPMDWGQALPDNNTMVSAIAELSDGTVILLTQEDTGTNLYRTALGQTECQPISITDWPTPSYSVEGTYGPSTIFPAGNGFVAVFNDQPEHGLEYRTADGVQTSTISNSMLYLGNNDVVANNQQVLVRDIANKLLLRYDIATGNKLGESACNFVDINTAMLLTEDAQYLVDATGLYRQTLDGDKWEQIFNGEGSSLSAPANIITGMALDGGDGYYIALSTSMGPRVIHYIWSNETPSLPDTELTVFSLKDYPILRQAISEYQTQNPNVKVTLQIPSVEGATTEDVIRALNTEILNGSGPDILVLDDLPAQSYAEKGVLLDLNSVDGLLEGVLPNLTTAQTHGDSIYQIPAQFTIPVIVSKTGTTQPDSMSTLLQQIQANSGDVPYLVIPPNLDAAENFLMDWYLPCAPEVYSNNTLDVAQLETVLGQIQSMHSQLQSDAAKFGVTQEGIWVETDSMVESIDDGIYQVGQGSATAHVTTLTGRTSLEALSFQQDGQCQIDSLYGRGRFLPQCSVGITANSQHQEEAEDFLSVLLSQSVQSAYVGIGFPVREEALKEVTLKTFSDENGKLQPLGEQFLNLCQTLHSAIPRDAVVEEAIRAQASTVLNGGSATDAANTIADAVNIYLAE